VVIYRPDKKESETEQFNLLLEEQTSIRNSHGDECFVDDVIAEFLNICNKFYHLANFEAIITEAKINLVHFLKQCTRSQTYITYDIKVPKESLLDHVYINNYFICESVDAIPTTNSDHDIITLK
jgi:hypothetical protein